MKKIKKPLAMFLALLLTATLAGCAPDAPERGDRATTAPTQTAVPSQAAPTKTATPVKTAPLQNVALDRNGAYTAKDEVALYIHVYGTLPGNFITKADARILGWTGGALARVVPGKSIGGDVFGNFEGLLPASSGRVYRECDIGTDAAASSRGALRIVYSNDGLVYYTGDHYASFTLLYGGDSP